MITSARSLSLIGAYLVRRAKSLAQSIARTNLLSKTEVIDGFLVRATRVGKMANGLVLDPPGIVAALNNEGDERGGLYSLHGRDFYASRAKAKHVELGRAAVNPQSIRFRYYPVGFSIGAGGPFGGPENPMDAAWLLRRACVFASERYVLTQLSVDSQPNIGEPNNDVLPGIGSSRQFALLAVMNAKNLTGAGGGQDAFAGYAISDAAIDELAPGFVLMRHADYLYTGWEYGLCPPAAAFSGQTMVAAIPIVKQGGKGVTEWGETALLVVGLNPFNEQGKADGLYVRWHKLWRSTDHPNSAVHSGPWVYQPEKEPAFNKEEWAAAWAGNPTNIGSRPNWIDCLSAQSTAGGVVFRFRYSIKAFVLQPGNSTRYPAADIEALVEIAANNKGELVATYPSYEVFTAQNSGRLGDDVTLSPYQALVVGNLPVDVVKAVWPMATLRIGDELIRVNAEFVAGRVAAGRAGDAWAGSMGGVRVDLFGLRVESATGNYLVKFSALGAGVLAPVIEDAGTGERFLKSSMASYKVWSLANLVAVISPDEIAILLQEQWEVFEPGNSSHIRLARINFKTGQHWLSPRIGFYQENTLRHERSPVLSVVQREVRSPDGKVTQKAVMLVSGAGNDAIFISRDGAESWQKLLNFPKPKSGAFYMGSLLMTPIKPGRAQLIGGDDGEF